jgi:prepilin-type N-terminal cleavage/methylation domain-containing protein
MNNTNRPKKFDARLLYRGAGVSPAIERLTLTGETAALHFKSPKANFFWYNLFKSNRQNLCRYRRGFTLLEVLVATAVSVLLLTLLLSATQGISSNYSRTMGSVIREGNSAFALDQIVQDLEGLVVPNFPKAEALRLVPETVEGTQNAAWLTLLSTCTDDDTSDTSGLESAKNFNGATRAISYRLAFQNPISESSANDKSYAIYRAVVSSLETFREIITSDDAQSDYWQGAGINPTDPSNLLAEHVVGFSIRFLKADGTWTAPDKEIRIGRDGATEGGLVVPGGFKRAELSIIVLSPEGAKRMADGMDLGTAITRYGYSSIRQTANF